MSGGTLSIDKFAASIIEGDGGLNEYQRREWVTWPYSDRVAASVWTMRCLANPDCPGSDVALEAIIARRKAGINKALMLTPAPERTTAHE